MNTRADERIKRKMIFDKVENIKTYIGIHDNLDKAIQAILTSDFSRWEIGKHDISEMAVFCNVVHLETKTIAEWERHEEYLDIHVSIKGSETIRCSDFHSVKGWSDFDCSADYALAPYSTDGMDVSLVPGWFLIVFPQTAHMPGLRNNSDYSEKAIFKVRIK